MSEIESDSEVVRLSSFTSHVVWCYVTSIFVLKFLEFYFSLEILLGFLFDFKNPSFPLKLQPAFWYLLQVGCILTDLIADDTKKGTVQFLRHIETHFLSAQETILAADFQNQNPNICKLSSSGRFGSKFVTVVVSGKSSMFGVDFLKRYS